jgi:hypothetical protein
MTGDTSIYYMLVDNIDSFVNSLLNAIPNGWSIPSCSLNTISRNVPSGDNLCMSFESSPHMYTSPWDESGLCCIDLDGHVIYRNDISGSQGLAVDRQGDVYICGDDSNDIQRLSPDGTFRDIVLSNMLTFNFLSVVTSLTRDPSVFKIKTFPFPPM